MPPAHPPVRYVNIPKQNSAIRQELLDAISGVISHGQLILGPEVEEFELAFAKLCRTKYAIGVNSGTDALLLALTALDVGPGDEVITVPNSFAATTSAIVLAGARPVFVDVDADYNINPDLIESAVTKKTKAILPVHLTGKPAKMREILAIAQRNDLLVIEDAAQAVMASEYGDRVGSLGHAGCFSLHPLKTLSACGDGGVITTNSPQVYEKLKTLRNIGQKSRNDVVVWSGNSRLDSIHAATLLVKLKYLEEWTEKRRNNALFYQENLNRLNGISLPTEEPSQFCVYHTFVILAEKRDLLKKYLMKQGIESGIHYPVPTHLSTAAKQLGYKKGDFPVTESQTDRILSLPVHHLLEQFELERVTESIAKFYQS